MNDFTKEELQNLLGMAKSIPIDDRILILKLEQMIEYYREPISEGNPMYRCIICESKNE
jgi:hypothetical protein